MFNIEEFDIKLNTESVGRSFIYTEEIDSTNRVLLESKEFNNDGTVFLAEYQTAGRGRKSRVWYSNSGQNLTFSIMLNREFTEKQINYLNLGTALAVAISVENLFQISTNLKWPNDILVGNRKLCGILIENVISGSKIEKVVIGIGLNVNQPTFPGSLEYPIQPTSVRMEFRKEVSREKLLSEFLNTFEEILELCETKPEKILEDYRSRSKMIGENIKVTDGTKTRFGKFENIDDNGYLVLKIGEEIETIHFGEVSLR